MLAKSPAAQLDGLLEVPSQSQGPAAGQREAKSLTRVGGQLDRVVQQLVGARPDLRREREAQLAAYAGLLVRTGRRFGQRAAQELRRTLGCAAQDGPLGRGAQRIDGCGLARGLAAQEVQSDGFRVGPFAGQH